VRTDSNAAASFYEAVVFVRCREPDCSHVLELTERR
jgi:hypothetical protein